ncbi:MAG: porin family protein, partial [Sulfurovaceae bacterium]|nr:porin family protein [Sulfurovaceae bacterium]
APVVVPAPVVVTPKPTPKPVDPIVKSSGPSGLYVGGALAAMAARSDCEGNRANVFSEEKGQDRQIGFTGILGYDFMDFLGAELRTSMGLSEDNHGTKMQQLGLYLKPNIDLGDALNLYGLLGYSSVNMSDCGSNADLDNKNGGLSYGAGLDYGVTENISVFTDVVNYLSDSESRSTWGTNVGVKYKF